MTYCIGISLDAGLVLTSDSRTNAGIDHVSTYSKMNVCDTNPDRFIVLMTAGNLATTQSVVEQLRRDMREQASNNLNTLSYMADIADYIGNILVNRIRRYTETSGFVPDASLILAGQIQGGNVRAFMIYPQGNYITTSEETPYLQIGESKYGKPVLDRFIDRATSLEDAAVCSLISMDSTMKSNASVGPPIEVLLYRRDSLKEDRHYRFGADHPYLISIRQEWAHQLYRGFRSMPSLPIDQN
ncbi:proteasome-type protease [Thiolinea disciformis]|uniref:proteasome-type protease n=1 Tax=Thiolinea disciformis TaxID=125614 RepID=UPI000477DA9B|nr:proteasome-type protease [Thiolinea disciformis]